MKNFQTVRQAKNIAKKFTRTNTIKWLEAAAEDGYTKEKNILDLKKVKIKPKFLNKVGNLNLKVNFFGKIYNSPLVIAPMGHQTQFHKLGEIETARGANKANILSFYGTQGRMSINDIKNKSNSTSLVGKYSLSVI